MAEDVLKKLKEAVMNYDVEGAVEASKEVIKTGSDPLKAIEQGLGEGLKIVGEKFGAGELFLPMLMIAAQAMKESLAVLEPALAKGVSRKVTGKVVIGTVEGDIHDIGKSIVAAMLTANGFEVHDIGCDVPTSKFIEKVKEVNPDIIGMSALLTTTMPKMTEVIDALKKEGLRGKVKVIVGGAPVSAAWAEQIGADTYGEDAMAAVDVAKKLVGK
ncbi:MAG: corrinoid protein [Candidatus Bathyarchaeota archaeon]|nr:corrinoid protein [Candidatus Bathyarchaeota archaeon]MDH5712606.1 corrinoid protein [Candidatus Bathyarchaeota archaeon]